MIERAIAALGEARASWSESDCLRAISDALPGHLGLDPDDMRALLVGLTEQAVDAIVNAAKAFGNGAEFAMPGVRVLAPQYVGYFNDPAKAKQAAAAAFAGGADVLSKIVNLGKQGIGASNEKTASA